MTTQHTQGRLTLELVESDSGTIRHLCPVDKDGLSVLTVVEHEGVKFAAVYLDDDARRLVACWNWCEGQETEGLELSIKIGRTAKDFINEAYTKELTLIAQRDELLAALKLIRSAESTGCALEYVKGIARAAIAKAEGGAA